MSAPTGASGTGPAALNSMSAIRLVAGRELSTRLHSKAFRVMTLIVLLMIVAMVVVFKLLAGSGPSTVKVGVLQGDAQQLAQVEATGTAVGQHLSAVAVSDDAAGRRQVADGDLAALIEPSTSGHLRVVVETKLDPGLQSALTVLARNLALDNQISALGGDPATVNAAVSNAGLDLQVLSPPHEYDVAQIVLGSVAGILIYLSLMTGGQLVAQGVVEEKSSRVVELLLATIRPWELMTGKVLGIGLLGLIQVAAYGIVGVGLASALGVLTLSLSAAAGTVIWLVVWYLIGFVMYAFAFAAAGALVSRQEDAAGVIMPVLIFVIVGYVLGISVLPGDPGNHLVSVLSVIPLFAPTLMPMRLAMGGVPAWEAALALVLALAMIPALAALAGRIYRNAVIHIGARVSLRKALAG
jgi:ABC-2 type transport system permease protein